MMTEVGQAGKRLREKMKVKGGIVDCGFFSGRFVNGAGIIFSDNWWSLFAFFVAIYYLLTAPGKRRGCSDPVADPGAPTYCSAKVLPKTAWKWKKMDREALTLPGIATIVPTLWLLDPCKTMYNYTMVLRFKICWTKITLHIVRLQT